MPPLILGRALGVRKIVKKKWFYGISSRYDLNNLSKFSEPRGVQKNQNIFNAPRRITKVAWIH